MRIFVTGATGYIGQEVARAFRAKGHIVYGLVRSKESAHKLSLNEIYPVIGDMHNPESFIPILDKVEVVVHCAFDNTDKTDLEAKTIDTILSILTKSSTPKAFLYTSGIWVYGNTNSQVVDESSPLNPIDIIKWRPEQEQKILSMASPTFRPVILRPGIVYGKVGGLMNLIYSSLQNGSVTLIGEGLNRWSMIHVQDLAYAYVAVAEHELSHVILNVTNESYVTVKEIVEAIAKCAGVPGKIQTISEEEATKLYGPLTQGLTLDQQVDNSRLKRLVGWQIHHAPFINEAEIYFNAWKASQEAEMF